MNSDKKDIQLETVVLHLIESTTDKDALVRECSSKALQMLSERYPNDIVEAIIQYREKNKTMPETCLLILLTVLEDIAQKKTVSDDIVKNLIQMCSKEMQKNDSSQAALKICSSILIFLGNVSFNQVLNAVFPFIVKTEAEPNPYILTTIGQMACSNSVKYIPHVKSTFAVLVNMMPNCRNEQSRIALSFVISKLCEIVLEYLEFPNEETDNSISKETFAEEVISAYNIIANSWVQAKEIKVSESAITALGPIFSLLPEEKAAQATSRAVTCLLNAYKRPCMSHHLITQCLATVIKYAPTQSILNVLEQILHSLGTMIVVPQDYSLPQTIKQHSEVLRCYDHLAAKFPEKLADLLIKYLRIGSEKDKIESLLVCSHLISGNNNVLSSRMNDILSAVRSVLQDQSIKVKKTLVKVIISLSCKGYAKDGSDFIEFLIRHCDFLPSQKDTDLSNISASTINLLSSTVEEMHPVLWITMLKLLTDSSYDHALPVVMKALTQICPSLDPKQEIKGEPNRDLVLCRCFALLGSPLNSNRGPAILQFLQQFSPFVSIHIADLWTHKLPQLINYLQVSEWSENEWESLLLEMINNTVTTIACHDSQWPIDMSKHLSTMLFSSGLNDELNVVLSTLAITTAVIEDKQMVSEHFDIIVNKFKNSQLNTKEIARAVGILSTAHLDLVLARLETIAHTELNKRNSRLLGLMKDSKAEAEMEKCREALLECYAAIANRCPLMELQPKLDGLTQWIMTQITAAKEPSGRDAALEAILNCAESLIRHKTETKHSIKCRSNICEIILQQMYHNKPNPLFIKVLTVLIKLPPPLVSEARQHIIRSCFDKILSQEPPSNVHESSVLSQALKQLGELIEEILMDSVTPDRLDEITTLLEPWIKHRNFHQRLSAITVLRTALLAYYHNMQPGYQAPSMFNQCGDLIGTLIVRYFDSQASIGKIAGHCAGIVLAISNVYEGHSHDPVIEKIFENLPETNTSWHLSKTLCSRLPNPQLHKLTGRLLDGLTDVDETACSNASDVLACVFTLKGSELLHYINDILGSLILQLVSSGSQPTNGVKAVLALAKHHPKLVINVLLKQPLPLHASIADCWKSLATDTELASFALDHILKNLSPNNLYDEECLNSTRPKIASFQPLAAASALNELASSNLISELLRNNFSSIFPSLLTLLAAYISCSPPVLAQSPNKTVVITNRDAYKIVPSRVVKDSLQVFLLAVHCEPGAEALASTSQFQHIDSLVSCIPQLTVSVCQSFSHLLPKLIAHFNEYNITQNEPQRIIITAFFAECLACQCSSQSVELVDTLIHSLLSSVTAPDKNVRALALRGLKYIANLHENIRIRHENNVFLALMQGLEDTDGNIHTKIPLEAMLSLTELLNGINIDTLKKMQVPIAMRVKPFFEKEELSLRSTSLKILGQLYSDEVQNSGYKEQILSSFTCLLLHLTEPESSVACKYTLRRVAPILKAPKVAEFLNEHLIDKGNLHFEVFASTLIELIVKEMNEFVPVMFTTCITYTKSSWANIRGNSAFLLGLLLKNMNPETKTIISLEPATTRLIKLLSDPSPDVRAKTIKSLPLLFLA